MSFIYRNWTVHNLVGHPLSEVSYLVSVPFVGKSKAEDISGWIHDATLPLKNTTQGRGQMKKGTLVRYDHKLKPIVGIVRYVCENTGLTKVLTTCGISEWAVTSQLRVIG